MKLRIVMLIVTLVIVLSGTVIAGSSGSCVNVLTQMGGKTVLTSKDAAIKKQLPAEASIQWPFSDILKVTGKKAEISTVYKGGGLASWELPYGFSAFDQLQATAYGRRGGCVTVDKLSSIPGAALKGSSWLGVREAAVGGYGFAQELKYPDIPCDDTDTLAQTLPVICPRMASARLLSGEDTTLDYDVVLDSSKDWYDGLLDDKNNPPEEIVGQKPAAAWDCKNVLSLDSVTTQFDWEDGDIVIGMDGDDVVTEGNVMGIGSGGAYAKLHYAVAPFKSEYEIQYQAFLKGLPALVTNKPGELAIAASDLMRCAKQQCDPVKKDAYKAMQYFLHFVFSALPEVDKAADDPKLLLHSSLEGAFWSKPEDDGYPRCEWFDTRYQAPVQTVHYKNFPIWDWDWDANPCVVMVVLEGDGSSTDMFKGQYFAENDFADDFVGFFKVCKGQTVVLDNYSKDLKITFSTGDAICKK